MKRLYFIESGLVVGDGYNPVPGRHNFFPDSGLLILNRTVYTPVSGRSYERILKTFVSIGASFQSVSFNSEDGRRNFNIIRKA